MKFNRKFLIAGSLVIASCGVHAESESVQTTTVQTLNTTQVMNLGTLEGLVNLRANIRHRGIDMSDRVLLAKPDFKSEQQVTQADTQAVQSDASED